MKEYTYIIARIRSKETQLLTRREIDSLIAAADAREAEQLIRDSGGENELWELLEDAGDETVLSLLRQNVDYHNIKASVKAAFSNSGGEELLLDHGSVLKSAVYESVVSREYGGLPKDIAATAEAATAILLRTQDGQLCDLYIDKARLAAAETAAKGSGDGFIKRYVDLLIDTANLKTAMRCAAMNKTSGFIENAVYSGGELDTAALIKAAAAGMEALKEFVGKTSYADTDMTSIPAFERCCDEKLTELCETAKFDVTSAAPILAYAHAKQTELAAMRLIISAKRSRIGNDVIRERIRRLYE